MSKKKIKVYVDNVFEYQATISKDQRKIKLKTSDNESWVNGYKNLKVGKIHDYGDGISIKVQGNEINLGYDAFLELYALMKLKLKEDPNLIGELKLIEE